MLCLYVASYQAQPILSQVAKTNQQFQIDVMNVFVNLVRNNQLSHQPTQLLLGPLLHCSNIGPYSSGDLIRRFQPFNALFITYIRFGRFYDIDVLLFCVSFFLLYL